MWFNILDSSKKGFGIGKAMVGASLTGGIGLVAGNLGAKKVRVTCLNCGKQFWAGKK
ncbi:Putative phage protein (fragment) [Clostridioides difficile]|uniref:Putative phage protein n=1 Tax=Clostridioides difficile TaxID=1496 RepID=A0A069AZI6_CLODI